MCLMMSALAAAAFFVLSAVQKKRGSSCARSARTAGVMFAAASLMWCVDGVASVFGGEPFLDVSRGDFILGLIVVAAGCAVYGLLVLRGKIDSARNA